LWQPFWKWRPVEIFQCQESIGTSLSTHISNFDDIGQCWIFAVLWQPFWKWRPVEIFQCQESIGTSLSTHISNFDDIGQCWICTAHFLCRVLAAILKMADISKIFKTQNCSSNGDLSLCQILCLLSIHLEVININVRNFNFPIGFYSNPHPL
jgi:hypothetical protein